jgi:hypothetical protein
MLKAMKAREVIVESRSLWSSPAMLVRKKIRDLQFCAVYQGQYDITEKHCFLLPSTDNIMHLISGAQATDNLSFPPKRITQHSPLVKGCGSSMSCPLSFAIFRQF